MAKKFSPQIHLSKRPATALVVGGAGFVGSHLCETLLRNGCRVYCLDNWTTGKKENIAHLFKNKNFAFIEQDITKPLTFQPPRFDYLFHLAAFQAYLSRPSLTLKTLLTNSLGTHRLLKLALKNKAKFLLASSLNIYQGVVSPTTLDYYFGHSSSSASLYSHHEAKRFSEALVALYYQQKKLNARIVRLGYLYGPRMSLTTHTPLANLFLALKKKQPLPVPGEGLQLLYPTYITDAVSGIIKAMFSPTTEGQIFTLVNPQPTSLLDLAHLLQKLSPHHLSVNFVADSPPSSSSLNQLEKLARQTQQALHWQPVVDLPTGLRQTIAWLLPSSPTPASSPTPVQKKSSKPRRRLFKKPRFKKLPSFKPKLPFLSFLSSRLAPLFFSLLLLFLFLIAPLFATAVYSYQGARTLKTAYRLFLQTSDQDPLPYLQKAHRQFTTAQRTLHLFFFPLRLFNLAPALQQLETYPYLGSRLALLGQQGYRLLRETHAFVTDTLHASHQDASATLSSLQKQTSTLLTQLAFLQALTNNQASSPPSFLRPHLQLLSSSLSQTRQKTQLANDFLRLLPQLLALNDKRRYLIVFQNNFELRPTGGFIGSFALVTFEKGNLLDFHVEDVYTADGQLKGHVDPPEPIAKYLGEGGWYLRDANWDPHFPTTAQRLQWFLEKELHQTTDGVVALNLNAVQLFLEAVGPIQLPDYQETITAQNIFERAEYYAELQFFPGSTQKKDFLGSLANQLFLQLENLSSAQLLQLASALEKALLQKDLLLYFNDPSLQNFVAHQGWAGSLRQLSSQPNVFSDYLFIVEANLGVNKANYFLDRQINHQVTFTDAGTLLETLTINYHNKSPSQTWPAGLYKTYLRLYLPAYAQPLQVTLADADEASPTAFLTPDISTLNDKKVLGFLVEVPVGSRRTLKVNYRLSRPLPSNKTFTYAFYLQKQSGTKPTEPFTLTLSYPSTLQPFKVTPPTSLVDKKLTFQTTLDQDRIFLVDFLH